MIHALSVILPLLWLLDLVTTLTADGLLHILLFVAPHRRAEATDLSVPRLLNAATILSHRSNGRAK